MAFEPGLARQVRWPGLSIAEAGASSLYPLGTTSLSNTSIQLVNAMDEQREDGRGPARLRPSTWA